MISELHRTARALASKGIPVFPCKANGKAPDTEHGFKDASADLQQIDAWWEENPNRNIGICPDAAGCAVVDVDEPAAIATLEILMGQSVPDTFTVQTPRGGFHYWFKGQLPPSVGKIVGKIDTRGVGSYVLYPPSVVDDKPYTILHARPFAPLPDSIKFLATTKRHIERATVKSDVELDLPGAVTRGWQVVKTWPAGSNPDAGDLTAFKHACVLREFALSPTVVLDMMLAWNASLDDPMTEDRIEEKVNSAFTNGENAEGVWGVKPPQELFADLVQNLPQVSDTSSRFRVLSEDDQDNIPPPTWLIENVLPANSTVMLYAPSQGWKTFLALDWALTVASGVDKWGEVDRGTAVYIAAEGAIGIARSRRPAWRMLHGIIEPLPFYVIPTMPWLIKSDDVLSMCDEILSTVGKPKLVVVDTLARAMVGLDESGAKDSSIAIEACDAIKRTLGCTVLVLHHTKKDGNGYRGSSALMAGFDSVIEFEADRDTMTGNVWIKKHKDAEVPDYPYRVKAEPLMGSLAFRMATDGDLPPQERLRPSDIGEALRRMKVFGEEKAVAERVLIFDISQTKSWDMKKATRLLRSLAKSGRSVTYLASKPGHYCLPAGSETSGVEFE